MDDPSEALVEAKRPSFRSDCLRELLVNSLYVPAVLCIYVLTCLTAAGFWLIPLVVCLLGAAVVQAVVLVHGQRRNRPLPLTGNLIAGMLVALVWAVGLQAWLPGGAVVVILGAGLLIGLAQHLQNHLGRTGRDMLVVTEDVVRTATIAVTYGLASWQAGHEAELLTEPEHVFLLAACLGLGVALGCHRVADLRHLDTLQATSKRLAELSQWSLGATHVQQALSDQRSLAPARRERAVLFADIRGFTAWSETRTPEQVLALLKEFYNAAEAAWRDLHPIKSKFTGDEVLLVFADAVSAARAALDLRTKTQALLESQGIGVGIGLHFGPLIEGLIGSRRVRAFDVLGDTVNTGKRVCDHAQAGEILCTFPFYEAGKGRLQVGDPQTTRAKGKSQTLLLSPLLGLSVDPAIANLSQILTHARPEEAAVTPAPSSAPSRLADRRRP